MQESTLAQNIIPALTFTVDELKFNANAVSNGVSLITGPRRNVLAITHQILHTVVIPLIITVVIFLTDNETRKAGQLYLWHYFICSRKPSLLNASNVRIKRL